MAARLRAIFLDKPDPYNNFTFNVALWADVPAGRQSFYAAIWGPTRNSAWLGALAADNTALQNGSVVERVEMIQGQQGWTRAQLQTEAGTRWQRYQDYINSNNPWVFYGTQLDPSGTWTNSGAP